MTPAVAASPALAVVTGAAAPRGIGFQICRTLAEAGFGIALCDRDAPAVEAAAAALREEFAVPVLARALDVTDQPAVADFRDEAVAHGGAIRVLVNNAGINRSARFDEITPAEWEEVFRVNVTGAFLVTQAFAPALRAAGWGRVVFLSSQAAIRGGGFFSGSAHYSASKAALLGLTRALARELGPDGVTVNAIAPGFITTDMTGDDAGQLAAMIGVTPVGRVGRPSDVASLVGYLATEDSGYLTGATLDVNGGSLIH